MKDLMLIDSSFSNNFWAKPMETVNYLYNKLPTTSKNHENIISKEL